MFEPARDGTAFPPLAVAVALPVPVAFAYAYWSTVTQTYPALWFAERYAYWAGTGEFGVGFTTLLTAFSLLLPLIGAVIVGAGLQTAWRRRDGQAVPADAEPAVRVRRGIGGVGGVGLALGGVGVGALAIDPTLLAPLGWGAVLLLLVIPMGPLWGILLITDALVPPAFAEGPPMVEAPDRSGNVFVRVDGTRFSIDPVAARDLAAAGRVRVVVSGFLGRLLWRG